MYTEFYRFSEKPFEDILDPRFFYRTPGCQKNLTSILTWTKEGNGFAVITGEAGTGKTLFIQTLSGLLGEKTRTVVVPNPAATFKEMLKQIFRSLDQPAREETKTALLHRFMRYLKRLAEQGETLVIVLDESQDLSHQVLEDVQHFFGLKSKPIRTILVGQPGLNHRPGNPRSCQAQTGDKGQASNGDLQRGGIPGLHGLATQSGREDVSIFSARKPFHSFSAIAGASRA